MNCKKYWQALLLGEDHSELKGSVIFPGSDEAVEFMCQYRDTLKSDYCIDDYNSRVHLDMLDKFRTLALAEKAGCPVPAFHSVTSIKELLRIGEDIVFPTMIKPVHSHLFVQHFPNRKYFTANNAIELREQVAVLLDKGIEVIVTEIIPGPDHLQSAYFTYITAEGKRLFDYTHQIVRRYPRNSGLACLTVTKKLPETRAMGQRFFQGVGFRGMGHIEFKRDPRDGKLKVIECNPRLSAAQEIVSKSGLDMAFIVYDYLVRGNVKSRPAYREGVRRWWLIRDIFSFLELRKSGDITFLSWLRSVNGPPLAFPYFSLSDPKPFFHRVRTDFSHFFTNRVAPKWMARKDSLRRP